MRRIFLILLLITACLSVDAQKGKPAQSTKTTQQSAKKGKQQPKATPQKSQQKGKRQPRQKPATVSSLRAEQARIAQQRKEAMKRSEELKRGVKKGMEDLMAIDTEIAHQRQVVDTIKNDIHVLNGYIHVLDSQLVVLEKELDERKMRYMKSMRYMHRNRSVQSQMVFIFSADNFNQMFRRMRFTREYASYQKAQGEAVRAKQAQVTQKRYELTTSKQQKDTLLRREQREQHKLEGQQTQQREQVEKLRKEQKSVQALIEQQQKQEAALNARIDQLIAEELAREKARQEAEAKKRAEEEAARKRQAELARKRAAAEAARKENERRIAKAKAKEEQARKAEQAAANKSAKEKEQARKQLQQAEKDRKVAEQQAKADREARNRDIAETRKSSHKSQTAELRMPAENQKLSGSFEANRGRLPLPITGAYRLIRGFGPYTPEGLSRVVLQSNGWYLKGGPGAKAQCIFNGVVSGVYYQGGSYIVTVRHGKYISVYINLRSVNVRNGQKVNTRDILGSLGNDNTMHFQLRNWNNLLNPSKWLKR